MKRRGLLFATLVTLILTGIVLSRAGQAATPRAAADGISSTVRNSLSDEAAVRYRQGQPTHWRACLLQR